MSPLAGISSGVLATLGFVSLAISGPTSVKLISSALSASEARTADQLDRSGKGDRLPSLAAHGRPATVTTVEVVGVHDTQIVYRDRAGRILFRTDPVANVTIVAKDVSLPAVTVREHSDAAPQPMPLQIQQERQQTAPVKTLREENQIKRPEGCDPVVSPLASTTLSQMAGRCIAGMPVPQQLALATAR
jgi:hypothetical protein